MGAVINNCSFNGNITFDNGHLGSNILKNCYWNISKEQSLNLDYEDITFDNCYIYYGDKYYNLDKITPKEFYERIASNKK